MYCDIVRNNFRKISHIIVDDQNMAHDIIEGCRDILPNLVLKEALIYCF
ncbi:MAG: hypothetical protein ACI83B_003391 [Sediminicola sp.]|jgi:hypothetical protein